MTPALVLLALYGAALLVLGWLASRRAASSPEDYFLAGSGLGTVVLFMALFGTNCTPFVLVGVPGVSVLEGSVRLAELVRGAEPVDVPAEVSQQDRRCDDPGRESQGARTALSTLCHMQRVADDRLQVKVRLALRTTTKRV